MTQTEKKPREFDLCGRKVRTIRVVSKRGDAVWSLSDVEENHDPADRVGGPFRIMDMIVDDGGWDLWEDGKFFLLCIQESHFPPAFLILARNFKDAYQAFVNWVADGVTDETPQGRRCMAVGPDEMADYMGDDGELNGVSYSDGGVPVDMQNVMMDEMNFHSCEA